MDYLVSSPRLSSYKGYVLKDVVRHKKKPYVWDKGLTDKPYERDKIIKLNQIPQKVANWIKKDCIVEVRRTAHHKKVDNIYFILIADGKYLEVSYKEVW